MKPKIRKPISEAALRGGTHRIILELEDIRERLAGFEMFRTYHKVSKALQEIGWELAAKLDQSPRQVAKKLKKGPTWKTLS